MANNIALKITIWSYWHAGSGLSAGTYADSIVLKDDADFPFLPGKTLKGLIRNAAETLHALHPHWVTASFIDSVFGRDTSIQADNPEEASQGKAFFSNAVLHPMLKQEIESLAATASYVLPKSSLYRTLASTAIDTETGVATSGSLRQIEVAVPIELFAHIYDFPALSTPPGESDYTAQLDRCIQFVKRLGAHRNRGLGRCQITRIHR